MKLNIFIIYCIAIIDFFNDHLVEKWPYRSYFIQLVKTPLPSPTGSLSRAISSVVFRGEVLIYTANDNALCNNSYRVWPCESISLGKILANKEVQP